MSERDVVTEAEVRVMPLLLWEWKGAKGQGTKAGLEENSPQGMSEWMEESSL